MFQQAEAFGIHKGRGVGAVCRLLLLQVTGKLQREHMITYVPMPSYTDNRKF